MKAKRFLTALLTAALLVTLLAVPSATIVSADEEIAETVFYYEDFENDLGDYVELTSTPTNNVTYSKEQGSGALKISSTAAQQVVFAGMKKWTVINSGNTTQPKKYVLEWRAYLKPSYSENSYIGTYAKTPGPGTGSESGWLNSSYAANTKPYAAMTDLDSKTSDNEYAVQAGKWVTMTCIYDYTKETPERTLYADGHLVGTSTKNIYTRTDGKIYNNFPFKAYFHKAGEAIYIDYVKAYTQSSAFTCTGSVDKTIGLNTFDITFSSTPAFAEPENFSFGEGEPAIVSAVKMDANTVRLVTASSLKADSDYTLSISGLTDTAGRSLNTQAVALKTQNTLQVTFNNPENGTVQVNGETVNGKALQYKNGDQVTFTAVPSEGYHVDSVLLGETPLIGSTDGVYTTAALTTDATITVTFAKDTVAPEIAYTYKNSVFTATDPVTIDGKEITGPKGIVFAKVLDADGYTLTEYGMEFAVNQADLETGKGSTYKAIKAKSTLGNYGICFYGNFAEGQTYYARPYAVYTKEGEAPLKVTGETIAFIPNPSL